MEDHTQMGLGKGLDSTVVHYFRIYDVRARRKQKEQRL